MLRKRDRKYWRKKALEATKLEQWNELLSCGDEMIKLNPSDHDGCPI